MARSLAQSPVVLTGVVGPQTLSWATGPRVSTLGHCPLSLAAQLAGRASARRSTSGRPPPGRSHPGPCSWAPAQPHSGAPFLWCAALEMGREREWLPHWFCGRPEVAILTGLVLSPAHSSPVHPYLPGRLEFPSQVLCLCSQPGLEVLQTLHLLAVPNTSTRPRAPARAGSMVVTGG